MTRKITLSIILLLLIFGCYEIAFGNQEAIRKNVASVTELKEASETLNTSLAELEKSSTVDFKEKKEKLATTIEEYNEAKKQYETIIPQTTGVDASQINLDDSLKDKYDVDFLWTIIGNYATEEGIDLKFDISKNTTSASSINNTSNSYVVCDLKFTITGNYINLTDFIYDLEDDDRLNFEINDFEMKKNGDTLEVVFNVKEIKLNNNNLIDSISSMSTTTSDTTSTNTTQEIGSDVSNNTTNTTNTTNTVSNSVN